MTLLALQIWGPCIWLQVALQLPLSLQFKITDCSLCHSLLITSSCQHGFNHVENQWTSIKPPQKSQDSPSHSVSYRHWHTYTLTHTIELMLLKALDGQIGDTHDVKGLIGVLVKQILVCLQQGGQCGCVCVCVCVCESQDFFEHF